MGNFPLQSSDFPFAVFFIFIGIIGWQKVLVISQMVFHNSRQYRKVQVDSKKW